jgi:hypothetical protein
MSGYPVPDGDGLAETVASHPLESATMHTPNKKGKLRIDDLRGQTVASDGQAAP